MGDRVGVNRLRGGSDVGQECVRLLVGCVEEGESVEVI